MLGKERFVGRKESQYVRVRQQPATGRLGASIFPNPPYQNGLQQG
jgi:hypothetical protein